MKKKKVAIIGTVGVPANYGGFETLTEHLIENLKEDYDITIYCSGKKYAKKDRLREYKGSKLVYLPLDANGIQSIPYDSISILHSLFFADVLLILGVAGAWLLPFVRFFTNKKIIISIDGIEWKRDKWSTLAKWYLFWAEEKAVKNSHIDISDNEAIQDYTAARYGTLSRIIEYGADHTLKVTPSNEDFEKYNFLNGFYAFKVCRIEPENNVHIVLEAFAQIKNINLVMVGNWDKSEYGIQLKNKYAAYSNIFILDPIYNQKKLDAIRGNASLYIHGHSAGGTNPSLVEAMYLGLPVLAYGVSYNRVTTESKARYFGNLNGLIKQLENLNNEELIAMGKSMFEIANRRYTWNLIAIKYKRLVEEALKIKKKGKSNSDMSNMEYETLLKLGYAHLKTSKEI
ncbi:MAG: hypothetical protein RLZZ546_1642 [Bacteroidota bacterium]|jgi:glycosyltransferase involved in cell wall biosynthesis